LTAASSASFHSVSSVLGYTFCWSNQKANVICQVHQVILSLYSYSHFYCLQCRVIQVLPLSVALCIQKRVKVSYLKWHL